MTRRYNSRVAALFLLPALLSCYDGLGVSNFNEPERARALADASTVEALIAGSFQRWYEVSHGYRGVSLMLSGVAFQHSSPFTCRMPYGSLPRIPIENTLDRECTEVLWTWNELYGVLASVADALRALNEDAGLQAELGLEETDRLMALARLVQGLAHGSLALLFDRGGVLDEISMGELDNELLPYGPLMDVALGYLYQAAALSGRPSATEVPAGWTNVAVTPDELVRVARSYAARFRASAARTQEERAAVDWAAVIADVDAGITEDWVLDMDRATGWANDGLFYGTLSGSVQAPYFILGMADQSGSYRAWLEAPLADRRPVLGGGDVLIVTPDTRFPRGATREEQEANDGSMFVIPTRETRGFDAFSPWARPDRGTWRWSYYWYAGSWDYLEGTDRRWPEIAEAELRLLKAEGLLRLGQPAAAAALVNVSRTAHGLAATDASGTNTDCVPRLPDGSCGDLMEMLKWEKRLETWFRGPFGASSYFDGRGWGDLYAGTFQQLPIPCSEMSILLGACYTFGGAGGASSSPGSGYRWPGER